MQRTHLVTRFNKLPSYTRRPSKSIVQNETVLKLHRDYMQDSINKCLSAYLLEWNPLESSDSSRKLIQYTDTIVCSISSGQKRHFQVYLVMHEKTLTDTGVCA